MATEGDKKYRNLLEALAIFARETGAVNVDDFLTGYAGDDWKAAKRNGEKRSKGGGGSHSSTVERLDF